MEFSFILYFHFSTWTYEFDLLEENFIWVTTIIESVLLFYSLSDVSKEKKLLFISLYFLIWGEAANVRFLPECLCYIFHHVRNCGLHL